MIPWDTAGGKRFPFFPCPAWPGLACLPGRRTVLTAGTCRTSARIVNLGKTWVVVPVRTPSQRAAGCLGRVPATVLGTKACVVILVRVFSDGTFTCLARCSREPTGDLGGGGRGGRHVVGKVAAAFANSGSDNDSSRLLQLFLPILKHSHDGRKIPRTVGQIPRIALGFFIFVVVVVVHALLNLQTHEAFFFVLSLS